MVKTVIVPLDGSATAETALQPAVQVAKAFGADLRLMTSTVGAITEASSAYLHQVVERLHATEPDLASVEAGRGISTDVAAFTWPGPAIIGASHAAPDALVCMSTHGRGGFGRLALGSVAAEVVGDTVAPVLLVGPDAKLPELMGRRVLLAWDGVDLDPVLLATTTDWAQALDLQVTAVHVRRPNADDYGLHPSSEWQDARHAVVAELEQAGVRGGALFLDGLDVADEIVRHATATAAGLIIMGSRRHRAGRQGPLDSVVLKTVRHAPYPVLVQAPERVAPSGDA